MPSRQAWRGTGWGALTYETEKGWLIFVPVSNPTPDVTANAGGKAGANL